MDTLKVHTTKAKTKKKNKHNKATNPTIPCSLASLPAKLQT
jgi:hypothetical protein